MNKNLNIHSNSTIKELTINLIQSDFGIECSQIIEVLQFKGRLTLKELEKAILTSNKKAETGHSNHKLESFRDRNPSKSAVSSCAGQKSIHKEFKERLKKNLFILIQQNIITFYNSLEKGKTSVYYQVSVQNILSRLRFGRYIIAAKTFMTENEAELISLILLHGRLHAEDIINLSGLEANDAQKAFHALLSNNMLTRVGVLDSTTAVDAQMEEERAALENKGPALTTNEIKKVKNELTVKRKINEVDEAERGSKIRRLRDDDWEEQVKEGEYSATYKVNLLQFHLLLRGQYISSYAEEKLNPAAGDLVRVLMDISYKSMYMLDQQLSDSMKLFTIHNAVQNAGLDLPMEGHVTNPLEEYLELMTTSHAPLLFREHDKYSLRLQAIMENIKSNIVGDIVKERCGAVAYRIWRLLHAKQKLDDKQISKMALVEEKDARTSLYDMLRLGLVFIQDVPKTIDHSAGRTLFLWYASTPRSITYLLQNSYKAINNLLIRRETEVFNRRALLEKARRSDILSGEASLSPHEMESIKRINSILERLGVAIARLDELCMILRDL